MSSEGLIEYRDDFITVTSETIVESLPSSTIHVTDLSISDFHSPCR